MATAAIANADATRRRCELERFLSAALSLCSFIRRCMSPSLQRKVKMEPPTKGDVEGRSARPTHSLTHSLTCT